jgi:DNA-binding response OmpR family regulator
MPSSRILVVDDDAWILRMVTTVLEKRGYEIFTARDGEEGLQQAQQVIPDLIVTDVMMPKLDGWALVKQLRATPQLAFTPVIFLTALGSDEDRIRGFRLGADDYLAKPFRFEELDLRVAKALKHRHPEAQTRAEVRSSQPVHIEAQKPKSVPGISGSLDQLGLSSLLIVLEMERKSGVLVLSHRGDDGEPEVGRVFLRAGRVARARLDGKISPKNHQAVYAMLTWATGSFEFTALEVDMEDEIKTSTTALLMEGARRIDEEQEQRSALAATRPLTPVGKKRL